MLRTASVFSSNATGMPQECKDDFNPRIEHGFGVPFVSAAPGGGSIGYFQGVSEHSMILPLLSLDLCSEWETRAHCHPSHECAIMCICTPDKSRVSERMLFRRVFMTQPA